MGGCHGLLGVGRLLAQGERHKQTHWEGSVGAASSPCGSARPAQTRASPVLARGLSRSLGCLWRLQASVSCGLLATCGLWKRAVWVEEPTLFLSTLKTMGL